MSLDINQIALHQLIKRDEQNLELVLRESLLEPTAPVEEMVAELHRVYSAKSKAYGLFNDDSELAQALRLSVRARKIFSRSAVRQRGAYVMNWQNIPLRTAALCCSATIAIWRWNTCWSRC
jgi:nucleoid-associated protein YejK